MASQTVRLLPGAVAEGMTNGNIEKPAVRMMPAIISPVTTNVHAYARLVASSAASSAHRQATTGAAIIHG